MKALGSGLGDMEENQAFPVGFQSQPAAAGAPEGWWGRRAAGPQLDQDARSTLADKGQQYKHADEFFSSQTFLFFFPDLEGGKVWRK